MEDRWGYHRGALVAGRLINLELFRVITERFLFRTRGASTQGSLAHSPTLGTTSQHMTLSRWQNGLIFKKLQLDM